MDAPDRGPARACWPGAGRARPRPPAPCWPCPRSGTSPRPPASLWIALAAAWAWATRRTGGGRQRCLVPLWAGPLALIGLGPAFVLVAATAPTQARRAAEAAAGAVVAAVCGGWAGPLLSRTLAGANSPLVYVRVVGHDPALAATAGGDGASSPCCCRPPGGRERRVQALSLWGIGFGLAAVGHSAAPARAARRGVGAGAAAVVTAIIPAAWAVAGPDRKRGS